MRSAQLVLISTAFVACGFLALAEQTPAPQTAGGRGQGVVAADGAAPGAQGRGQGRGAGRGARTRKVVLAWADTRNGQAQHDSVSHALAVIERLGYESGVYDTYIRTDSNIIAKTAAEDRRHTRPAAARA